MGSCGAGGAAWATTASSATRDPHRRGLLWRALPRPHAGSSRRVRPSPWPCRPPRSLRHGNKYTRTRELGDLLDRPVIVVDQLDTYTSADVGLLLHTADAADVVVGHVSWASLHRHWPVLHTTHPPVSGCIWSS